MGINLAPTSAERIILLSLAATPNQSLAELQAATGITTGKYFVSLLRSVILSGRVKQHGDGPGATYSLTGAR